MTNAKRAEYGAKAVEVGSPDFGQNSENGEPSPTDLVDALANLMHYAKSKGFDFTDSVRIAEMHFEAESAPIPSSMAIAYDKAVQTGIDEGKGRQVCSGTVNHYQTGVDDEIARLCDSHAEASGYGVDEYAGSAADGARCDEHKEPDNYPPFDLPLRSETPPAKYIQDGFYIFDPNDCTIARFVTQQGADWFVNVVNAHMKGFSRISALIASLVLMLVLIGFAPIVGHGQQQTNPAQQTETQKTRNKDGSEIHYCNAPTKAGGKCKRHVKHEGDRCFMHQGK